MKRFLVWLLPFLLVNIACGNQAVCGNLLLEEGEQCDDGNNEEGDGCDDFCFIEEFCGDGVLDFGEECDDGNNIDSDGCEADCSTDTCQNGIVEEGEFCLENTLNIALTPIAGEANFRPKFMTLADVNNDDVEDIIIIMDAREEVGVLIGNGDGTFSDIRTFQVEPNPNTVSVGDMDNDGIPDLLVGSQLEISILRGNGDGSFAERRNFSSGNVITSIALDDIDQNGNLDVIASAFFGDVINFHIGSGNGALQVRQIVQGAQGEGAQSVIAGHFNEDSFLDLAACYSRSDNVEIFLGNANGTFSRRAVFSFEEGSKPNELLLTDINQDGHIDIFVTLLGTSEVTVLTGDGDGTFSGSPAVSTNQGTTPVGATIADFNNDGLLDAITASGRQGSISFLPGKGDDLFHFEEAIEIPIEPEDDPISTGNDGIRTGDLNGDDLPDLVVINEFNDEQIQIFLSSP